MQILDDVRKLQEIPCWKPIWKEYRGNRQCGDGAEDHLEIPVALLLSLFGRTRKSKAQVREAPEESILPGVKDIRILLNKVHKIKLETKKIRFKDQFVVSYTLLIAAANSSGSQMPMVH